MLSLRLLSGRRKTCQIDLTSFFEHFDEELGVGHLQECFPVVVQVVQLLSNLRLELPTLPTCARRQVLEIAQLFFERLCLSAVEQQVSFVDLLQN